MVIEDSTCLHLVDTQVLISTGFGHNSVAFVAWDGEYYNRTVIADIQPKLALALLLQTSNYNEQDKNTDIMT